MHTDQGGYDREFFCFFNRPIMYLKVFYECLTYMLLNLFQNCIVIVDRKVVCIIVIYECLGPLAGTKYNFFVRIMTESSVRLILSL